VIVDGVPREMVKVQAYEAVERSADQRRAAVVLATLTCADIQVESVFDDFLSFFDGVAAERPPPRERGRSRMAQRWLARDL
jgi:hypothetical protein